MQFVEDKVYLRDVRSGNIYLYERHLAQNRNFEACVPNPSSITEQDMDDSNPDE